MGFRDKAAQAGKVVQPPMLTFTDKAQADYLADRIAAILNAALAEDRAARNLPPTQ